jgi:hypothetical protein
MIATDTPRYVRENGRDHLWEPGERGERGEPGEPGEPQ